MRYHLLRCWQCRTRLAELERQVRRLSSAYRSDLFPSPGRVDAARRRFFADAYALGVRRSPAPRGPSGPAEEPAAIPPRLGAPRALMLPALLTFTLLLAAAVLFFWSQRANPEQWAESALASARAAEESLQDSPQVVRQTFLVEIVERKPKPRRRHGRLEIVSDPQRNRFSSRWTTLNGSLRHALWQAAGDSSYVYRAASRPARAEPYRRPPRTVSLVQVVEAGDNVEALERAFTHWLESREWRPLALSSDLAVFTSRKGAVFRAEPVAGPEGHERIRLTALRRGAGFTLEVTMELDRRTYRPRVKRIRYESEQKSLELIFVAGPVEFVAPHLVKASLFRPPRRLLAGAGQRPAGSLRRSGRAGARKNLPERPGPGTLADLEAEALFALHRLNVCRGEQVEVARDNDRIAVRGVVDTPKRKTEILSALAQLSARRWLVTEISTVDEAVDKAPLDVRAPYSVALTQRVTNRIPVYDGLLNYFARLRSSGKPEWRGIDPRLEVQRFAIRANTRWDAVRIEAFALRRLAERYPADDRLALLSQHDRWLIETIIQDHFRALHQKAQVAFAEIQPVFQSLSGAPPVHATGQRDLSAAFAGPPMPGWQHRALELFRQVTQCHEAVRSLLTAGREYPADKKGGNTTGSPPVQETLSALLNRAARLAEASANFTTAGGRGTKPGPPDGPP